MFYIKKRNNSIFNEMNNLFDSVFTTNKFMKTDIVEKDDAYLFTVDLPGIEKDELSIQMEKGYLTIKFERTKEKEEKTKYLRRERYSDSATRSYYLGEVDEAGIKAKLENGILSVFVPKTKEQTECKKCISIE